MCAAAIVKLGLFLPAALHARMLTASQDRPRGAVQDDYAAAIEALLEALERGEAVTFACVRGPKRRVTVRLTEALALRLRVALE